MSDESGKSVNGSMNRHKGRRHIGTPRLRSGQAAKKNSQVS